MSRPKNDCYGYICMRIKKYPEIKNENTKAARVQCEAIESALKEIENQPEKTKAVKMVLFDKTHTLDGAAMELHYSYWTIKRWIQKYINDVAKKAGF